MTAKKRKFWNIPPEEEQTGLLLWFQILQKHYLKLFGANAIAVLSLLPCAYFIYLLIQTGDIVFWGLGLALFVLASPCQTGLHSVCVRLVHRMPVWVKDEFINAWKQEWKPSMLLGLILGVLWSVLSADRHAGAALWHTAEKRGASDFRRETACLLCHRGVGRNASGSRDLLRSGSVHIAGGLGGHRGHDGECHFRAGVFPTVFDGRAGMKKKLEHIWYYYKWYILAAALVILVAANFIGELGQRRQPDGVVSIVTTSQVPEETVEKIRTLFETLWGDRNQDGVTDVEVNVYAYDGMGYSGGSADDYAAAAVHLASEIQAGTTDLFLSDAEELMLQAERLQYYGTFREYDALHRLDCAELEDFGVYAFPEKAALLDMLR